MLTVNVFVLLQFFEGFQTGLFMTLGKPEATRSSQFCPGRLVPGREFIARKGWGCSEGKAFGEPCLSGGSARERHGRKQKRCKGREAMRETDGMACLQPPFEI